MRRAPNILDTLDAHTTADPDRLLYRYLVDGECDGTILSWSRADLQRRARHVAAQIIASTAPGDRVVLLFPPGLDFIPAFEARDEVQYSSLFESTTTRVPNGHMATTFDTIVALYGTSVHPVGKLR